MAREIFSRKQPEDVLFLGIVPEVGDKIIDQDIGLTSLVIKAMTSKFRTISRVPSSSNIRESDYERRILSSEMPLVYEAISSQVQTSDSLDYQEYNGILTKAGL